MQIKYYNRFNRQFKTNWNMNICKITEKMKTISKRRRRLEVKLVKENELLGLFSERYDKKMFWFLKKGNSIRTIRKYFKFNGYHFNWVSYSIANYVYIRIGYCSEQRKTIINRIAMGYQKVPVWRFRQRCSETSYL